MLCTTVCETAVVSFDVLSSSFFLGAFVKLRKATISFVMSVRLSVRRSTWNDSAPTGRTFMKFDI